MNGQRLHLVENGAEPNYADLCVAAESLNADFRYLVWSGVPPTDRRVHARIAPTVGVGTLSGRPAYLERVPAGTSWSALPDRDPALCRWVAGQIMQILADLDASGFSHGSISEDRVWISTHGEVLLIGAGRTLSPPSLDRLRAWGLAGTWSESTLPTDNAADAAASLLAAASGGEVGALSRRVVRANAAMALGDRLPIQLSEEGIDEVVPDIGPDQSQDGILDRWQGTTGGRSGDTTGRIDITVGALKRSDVLSEFDFSAGDDTTGSSNLNLAAIAAAQRSPLPSTHHDEITQVHPSPLATRQRRFLELAGAMALGALLMWLWKAWGSP